MSDESHRLKTRRNNTQCQRDSMLIKLQNRMKRKEQVSGQEHAGFNRIKRAKLDRDMRSAYLKFSGYSCLT